jgi:hypothetical protein
MSQVDEEVLPGAADEQEGVSNGKMIPLGESIRYRKRAQSAEKRAEELAGELAEARAESARIADELKATRKEQELIKRLSAEGAKDLETAGLIAKARISGDEKADLGGIVERLKKEKGYLFSQTSDGIGGAGAALRTSPARESKQTPARAIDRAARKAAGTGSRTDVQEYMRKRRNVL